MKPSTFSISKAFADLEYPSVPGSLKALHTQLGRWLQIIVSGTNELDVNFREGRLKELGGFHFEVLAFNKKAPDLLDQARTQPQAVFSLVQSLLFFSGETTL
jgi:hypothetical protein